MKTLRGEGNEVEAGFVDWLKSLDASQTCCVVIEGLLCAGKSHLGRAAANTGFEWIELDSFLGRDRSASRPWLDCLRESGAAKASKEAILSEQIVVIDGAVAWPFVLESLDIGRLDSAKRVYVKCLKGREEEWVWARGETLDVESESGAPFFRSVSEYHFREQPWTKADLIVERYSRET